MAKLFLPFKKPTLNNQTVYIVWSTFKLQAAKWEKPQKQQQILCIFP